MGLSFAPLGACLDRSRAEGVARRWFLLASVMTAVAFVGLSLRFGLQLEYRFEVAAITINWVTLIAGGALVAWSSRPRARAPVASTDRNSALLLAGSRRAHDA